MNYAEMNREDRRKVRREMLREAEKLVSGGNAAQRKAMARMMVDSALAREKTTHGKTKHSIA